MENESRFLDSQGREPLKEPLLDPETQENFVVSRDSRYSDENDEEECAAQHRNINLTLAFTLFAFAGRSLWSQSVLSTLVYLLRNENTEAVGFITAVMGMSQLIASFPTGVLADRYRRDPLLKIASVVGLFAVAATIFSVWKESYQCLTVALAVWGTFYGICTTSLSALFADSIQVGDRSFYFTRRSIVLKIGNMVGPVAALVMFALLGDQWTIRDCSIVMGSGQLLSLPAVLILCFLNDDHAVQDDELRESIRSSTQESTENDESSLDDLASVRSLTDSEHCCRLLPEHRYIPVLISIADVLSGLGSGMSIRYFPIFFFDNLKLSPVIVQVLYIISPLGQAILMQKGQVWSRSVGRCRMTVVFKWIGVCCMLLMVASYIFHFPIWLICVFYLIRTSFMNATSALTKSVLMDAVPKNERAKWSALESVNMFSWSGSAFLGGLLVGYEGIIFNFLVTGSIQFLATLPLVLLFRRENSEEETSAERRYSSDRARECSIQVLEGDSPTTKPAMTN